MKSLEISNPSVVASFMYASYREEVLSISINFSSVNHSGCAPVVLAFAKLLFKSLISCIEHTGVQFLLLLQSYFFILLQHPYHRA